MAYSVTMNRLDTRPTGVAQYDGEAYDLESTREEWRKRAKRERRAARKARVDNATRALILDALACASVRAMTGHPLRVLGADALTVERAEVAYRKAR